MLAGLCIHSRAAAKLLERDMGRPLLGDRPTTGAERKRKWRERQREKQKLDPAFDPNADGMSVLMARALPILTPGLGKTEP